VKICDNLIFINSIANGKYKELFIVKIVITTFKEQKTVVIIKGKAKVKHEGTLLVLSHPDNNVENSLSYPGKIIPLESRITGLAKRSVITFAPNSVNILRLKLKKY
jgi:alpha-L-arabinofuranosidase